MAEIVFWILFDKLRLLFSRINPSNLSVRRQSIVPSTLSVEASDSQLSSAIPDTTPMWDTSKEMIHFPLLSNPIFILVALSNMFARIGTYVPLVYLPNAAVLGGVGVKEANFLISIFGEKSMTTSFILV